MCFDQLRVLISTMTTVFQNFTTKYQNMELLITNLRIFIFVKNFALWQSADFKCGNSFSKLQPANTQIKQFWSKLEASLFCTKLCLMANLSVNFRNLKNTFVRHFLSWIWKVSVLYEFLHYDFPKLREMISI